MEQHRLCVQHTDDLLLLDGIGYAHMISCNLEQLNYHPQRASLTLLGQGSAMAAGVFGLLDGAVNPAKLGIDRATPAISPSQGRAARRRALALALTRAAGVAHSRRACGVAAVQRGKTENAAASGGSAQSGQSQYTK